MRAHRTLALVVIALGWSVASSAAALESKQLGQAKDFIAEEQWTRAIEVLRAAAKDPKEPSRDEALYWLAHSLNQAGDSAAALESIRTLEHTFPASLWVKPAGALRIEMAVRLRRTDVLWWTAMPRARVVHHAPGSRTRRGDAPDEAPESKPTPQTWPQMAMTPPALPAAWLPEGYHPDIDLRIQALGSLMRTDDAPKAIPMLRTIALESENTAQAGRAVIVLAMSGRPEARATVVHVANTASEPVRIAAVRELGRFGGREVSEDLLHVYTTASAPVKLEVVRSLGQLSEPGALLRIVESEKNRELRDRAIIMLGRAGASEQLQSLYLRSAPATRRSIITALFNARAERELIHIAEQERNSTLREGVLQQLRLLGTPGAKAYLQRIQDKR